MNEQALPQAKDWLWEDLHSCWSYCMPEKGPECNMRLLGEHNGESLAHNTQSNSTASARNEDMFGDTCGWL